ncbi:MAG: hypothetical protein ABI665_23275 [Vicinamibacterales bacterium]
MKRLLLIAALVLAVGCVSSLVAEDLPIPSALKDARTVYVVNTGVNPHIVDNSLKALRTWNRWALVADAKDADITLTLSSQPTKHVYNWFSGGMIPVNMSFLTITGADGTALYGTTFVGNPKKQFAQLAKRLD